MISCIFQIKIQDTTTYNILKDFVFPFLLTIISVIVAWFVFFRQIVIDKQKIQDSKVEDLRNKLTYFAMKIDSAIDNAEGQNSLVNEMIVQLAEEKIESITLSKYPTYDLKVVAEKLDAENYLLSYISFYSTRKKVDVMLEFKEIIDSCGIINDVFNQIHDDIASKHAFITELSDKFLNLSEECAILFGQCLVKLREEKNPLFTKLFNVHNISVNFKPSPSDQLIEVHYNVLLKPLLELLDASHQQNIEFDQLTGDLWITTGKAISIYKNLKAENIHHKVRITEDYNLINETIQHLKNSSVNLRNDFLN